VTSIRPTLFVTGVVLSILAVAMLFPAAVDAVHDEPDWRVFAGAALVTLFIGLALLAANRQAPRRSVGTRQIFLLTAIGWIAASAAAALPFAFAGLHLSTADAVFEAVAGTTDTGATVLRDLGLVPPGILLWRALLQWLGGIGFLAMAIVILPTLYIGGMQAFRLETVGGGDRVMPRAARMVMTLAGLYVALTIALTLLLWIAGMHRFSALLHAMSTISCGGFSTADGSIGAWHRAGIDWVILFGMLLGGAPFVVYLQLAQRRWRDAWANRQLPWYFAIFLAATAAIALWLWFHLGLKPLPALRHAAFAAASVMTGTGYATLDYARWSGFPAVVLLFLAFVGGCAGSTAGGIKVFRVRILFVTMRDQFIRLLHPHAVLDSVPDPIAESVLGYLFVYALAFAVVAMGLGAFGLDFFAAVSTAASALANLGPGLVPEVGPMAGYAHLAEPAKWLLAATMLFGRLEMFVLLVLFTPSFWRP
jgi:trk system potassium uptake protein TrkH